jgi:hypothetical protein
MLIKEPKNVQILYDTETPVLNTETASVSVLLSA